MIGIITGNLCFVTHKTRTAKVTVYKNLRKLPDRPRQLPTPQNGDTLPPSEAQSIVVKHEHPRMNLKAVSVTQWCFFAQQSIETQKLSRDIKRTTGSDIGCWGPHDINRDSRNRLGTSVKPARPG